MNIYTVTVFKHFGESREAYSKNRQRTWGYYLDFKKAEQSVMENWTDMFEDGYYDVALIEMVPEGICQRVTAMQWYSAVNMPRVAPGFANNPVVTRIDTPSWAIRTCNWSMS